MKTISNTIDLLNHVIGFLTKHPTVSERAEQTFGQPIRLVEKFTKLRDKITKESTEAHAAISQLDSGTKRFRELRDEIKQDAEDLEDIVSVVAHRENIDIPAPVFHSGAKFLPELEQYLLKLKPFRTKLEEIDPYKLLGKIESNYQELKGLLDETSQGEKKIDKEVDEFEEALFEGRRQWKVLYGALREVVKAYFPELKEEFRRAKGSNASSKVTLEEAEGQS